MIPWNLTDAVGTVSGLGIITPILLENDAGEVHQLHHPAAEGCVPCSCSHCDHQMAAKRFGSGSSPEAPPSRGHRGLRTLPHQFSSYGSCEGRDLQAWTPRPPRVETTVTECVRAVTAQGCRRVLVEVRRRVEICLAKNGIHSDYLLQFPERGSNGDDKRWIWISNDHGSNLAPNAVCGVINTRAGSERNVSVFSETPCMYVQWRIYGGTMWCSPLGGDEGVLWTEGTPIRLIFFYVHNGVIFSRTHPNSWKWRYFTS